MSFAVLLLVCSFICFVDHVFQYREWMMLFLRDVLLTSRLYFDMGFLAVSLRRLLYHLFAWNNQVFHLLFILALCDDILSVNINSVFCGHVSHSSLQSMVHAVCSSTVDFAWYFTFFLVATDQPIFIIFCLKQVRNGSLLTWSTHFIRQASRVFGFALGFHHVFIVQRMPFHIALCVSLPHLSDYLLVEVKCTLLCCFTTRPLLVWWMSNTASWLLYVKVLSLAMRCSDIDLSLRALPLDNISSFCKPWWHWFCYVALVNHQVMVLVVRTTVEININYFI